MTTATTVMNDDQLKEALSEQIRLIPSPEQERIKLSWQKVSQVLLPKAQAELHR